MGATQHGRKINLLTVTDTTVPDAEKKVVFIATHSQGQEGAMNLLHTPKGMLADLTPHLNTYWPVKYIPVEFSGSLNDCLAKEFHISSGTFEIPQSGINNEAYLTIDDYYNYGKGIALGITDYLTKLSKKSLVE